MTTKITTIDTNEGTITIKSDVFQGYNQEAMATLETINEAKKDFKEIVEAVATTTGMKKAKVSKYFQARYAEKTKDAKELGVLFEKLDEVMN